MTMTKLKTLAVKSNTRRGKQKKEARAEMAGFQTVNLLVFVLRSSLQVSFHIFKGDNNKLYYNNSKRTHSIDNPMLLILPFN
jgi:hypothetical protein